MRISGPLVLVDSNILLRRVQITNPLFAVVDYALRELARQGCQVYICPQNHAEFWAVATRPVTANGLGMTPQRADAELSRMEMLFPLLPDAPGILPAWRRLVVGAGVSGKATHDARLLSVAQMYGVQQLLTLNTQDFTRDAALAPGVQIIDPQTV